MVNPNPAVAAANSPSGKKLDSGWEPQDNGEQVPSQDRNIETIDAMKALRTALPSSSAAPNNAGNAGELPRFGDLSVYKVSDADEARLWELEATRLVDGLATAHAPLRVSFKPGATTGSLFRHSISHTSFAKLETMADQLLCALAVCGLDDQAMLLRFDAPGRSVDEAVVSQSHMRLKARLDNVDSTIQELREDRSRYRSKPKERVRSGRALPDDPSPTTPVTAVTDADGPDYYLLVDYMTATLARLLAVDFESRPNFWHRMALTALAKLSVKLKVLSHNLPEFAATAMGQPAITRRLLEMDPWRDPVHADDPKAAPLLDSYIIEYMADMSAVSTWLFRMLWHVTSDLETRNTRGRDMDEFDISVTVYGTGPRPHPTMVYQDRRGHISGSPSSVAVGLCHRAFNLLLDTAASIRGKQTPLGTETTRLGGQGARNLGRPNLLVTTGRMPRDLTLELRSMADLISVMVPLSNMNPAVAEGISNACRAVNASETIQLLHDNSKAFATSAAFASLHNVIVTLQEPPRPRVQQARYSRSLSQSFLARPRHRATAELSLSALRQGPAYTSGTKPRITLQQTQTWAIEETAISVGCLAYTLGVLSGCAVLVIGGLLAGFLVGSRIDGVDPFNLTMFSWIVAGFIVLVAKSVRVAEWPWRDFLKGRVTCRSVQELASVTGLDEQAIIAHLLSSESETPLLAKGPYNSAFSNTDSDGFSIDVPPKVGTLALSGIVILEVLTESGPALVSLDLRPRTGRPPRVLTESGPTLMSLELRSRTARFPRNDSPDMRCLVHAQAAETERLACFDPAREDDEGRGLEFRWQGIRWEKIIGVYDDEERAVV